MDQPFLETIRQSLRVALRKRSTGNDGFPETFKIEATPGGVDHPFCSHSPQWDLPESELKKIMEEVPDLQSLERLGDYFCYYLVEAVYEREGSTPKPILEIELREKWRSQEVHRQLKEVKRVLTRFRKLTAGLVDKDLPYPEKPTGAPYDHPDFQTLSASEADVLEAEWWLHYQLWTRRDPWPVTGLAKEIGTYTDALQDCWKNIRLDGGGDPYLSALRTRRWAANGRMIRSLINALQP